MGFTWRVRVKLRSPALKRVMDLFIAIPATLVFIPIWILISILNAFDSPGSPWYIHERCGQHGKKFRCYKFRTMYTGVDPNKLAESGSDNRITKFGKFLRNSSLDETLQLINVLLGDMSIVGPRPALQVQVGNFSERDQLKLSVKPGITGWTQVNGRNSIDYPKRMELDVWYALNHDLFLDIQIILKTFSVIMGQDGVYDPNSLSPTKM